jgi:hypothetical protein
MSETQVTKACVGCGLTFTSYAYKQRQYCSMACLREHQKGVGNCSACGRQFTFKASRPRKYCSVECHHANGWKVSSPEKKETKACPECGSDFTYYKCKPTEYCSRECRMRHEKARKAYTCLECGKDFEWWKNQPRRYCSRACAAKNTMTNVRGFRPTAFETNCEQCGKSFKTTPARTRGRFCSFVCWGHWLEENAPTGAANPNWRGGYEPYYGANWRQQRRAARRRDRYTCQDCGKTEEELGKHLDVHHVKRFGDFTDYREANQLSNLLSLCPKCHTVRDWDSEYVASLRSRRATS